MIGYKLWYVIIPRPKESEGRKLRNCNNWNIFLFIRGFMGTAFTLPIISYVFINIK